MKDYTIDFETSKNFILNYEIKDNQIVVNFASGEEYIIPYTEKNEEKIIDKMEEQIKDSDYLYEEHKDKSEKSWKSVAYDILFFILNVGILSSGMVNYILPIFCGSLFILAGSIHTLEAIKSKQIMKDIDKNRFFLENQELLSDNLNKNQNVLSDLKKETKELISSTPSLTVNTIDKIKLSELKLLLENIYREKEFNFDYSNVIEEKPAVYKKTK